MWGRQAPVSTWRSLWGPWSCPARGPSPPTMLVNAHVSMASLLGVLGHEGEKVGYGWAVPRGGWQAFRQLSFFLHQGVSNDTSSLETERGFEELPLCSCRMEAPKIDRISERAGHKCMATESVDGEVHLGLMGEAPAKCSQP